VHITFQENKVRAMCEKRKVADRELGTLVAEALRARLTDLIAAQRIEDLPVVPAMHEARGNLYSIHLVEQWVLNFQCIALPSGRGELWNAKIISVSREDD